MATSRGRITVALGVATGLFAATLPARAETIDATSTTLLAGHSDPRDGKTYTVVPVYEMVSLTAGDLRVPYIDDLRIQISGWGMAAFGNQGPTAAYPNPISDNNGNPNCRGANASLSDTACITGDLDLGNIEGRVAKRHITFKLGRQFVVGGAARMTQLDGAALEFKFYKGLGLQLYGGAPVTPRFATSRGDAIGGGRVFYRHSVTTEVGASAVYVLGAGRTAREDVALDARYSPLPQISFTGYGLYSLYEMRIGEANLAVTAQPWRIFDITADYRRIAPDLFLPRNSIFSVFSQETRDEAGVWFSIRPRGRTRIYGDYHAVVDDQGLGHRAGLKGSFAVASQTTLGAEARLLKLPDKGYLEGRLFGLQRLGEKVTITLDLDGLWLEQALNGRDYSLTAAATVGWDFAPGWKTVVTAMGDVGPYVDGRLEVMAKLVYNHTYRFHESTPNVTPEPAKAESKAQVTP